jgi:hypothetical protein
VGRKFICKLTSYCIISLPESCNLPITNLKNLNIKYHQLTRILNKILIFVLFQFTHIFYILSSLIKFYYRTIYILVEFSQDNLTLKIFKRVSIIKE